MFGDYVSKGNDFVEKVVFEASEDSRYRSSNNNGVVVVDTRLGRVYINDVSYFISVPEVAWRGDVSESKSAKTLLISKIGKELTGRDVQDFRQRIEDLVDAEFSKSST